MHSADYSVTDDEAEMVMYIMWQKLNKNKAKLFFSNKKAGWTSLNADELQCKLLNSSIEIKQQIPRVISDSLNKFSALKLYEIDFVREIFVRVELDICPTVGLYYIIGESNRTITEWGQFKNQLDKNLKRAGEKYLNQIISKPPGYK